MVSLMHCTGTKKSFIFEKVVIISPQPEYICFLGFQPLNVWKKVYTSKTPSIHCTYQWINVLTLKRPPVLVLRNQNSTPYAPCMDYLPFIFYRFKPDVGKYTILYMEPGQIIATSHDLTPNGGLVREIPFFQENPG